mgnify:CR=1 FL=1
MSIDRPDRHPAAALTGPVIGTEPDFLKGLDLVLQARGLCFEADDPKDLAEANKKWQACRKDKCWLAIVRIWIRFKKSRHPPKAVKNA